MSRTRLRSELRWSHIAIGIVIGSYICSPLHLDPTATLIARFSLLPLVGLTGIAMWQQARLNRIVKTSGRGARLEAARS